MGVKFKNQMNNKTLYNQFFISAAVELAKDQLTGLGPGISAAIELKELESFKPNHDPRTENKFLFFNFINNVQATSDRVQAKRGTLINFFYS
tara:strand:- start:260 stop:535 length:276 start_codon:yes stop_codon:yes gene_type:complete